MADAIPGANAKFVTVACKHPPGILMRVFDQEKWHEPVFGGGTREVTRALANGKPVKINGPAVPPGITPAFIVAGGYALTPNVPADTARKWMEQNRHSDMVTNKVIFIQETTQRAADQAKEQKALKSGLERLDVGTVVKNGRAVPKDYRWPAKVNPNLSGVMTDQKDEAA